MNSPRAAERLLFEQLVRESREDLLAYAMRRAANAEDAADVLSETYLIAWRKLEKIPPGASARLWLFGVAGNVLRRAVQRHRSSEALIERLASEPHDTVQIESAGREDQTTRDAARTAPTVSQSPTLCEQSAIDCDARIHAMGCVRGSPGADAWIRR